ncbi:Uncharacterised protein [Klebsiella pneumoniae]|nr:Uncharacterised protein [Klebsiella pneumoniae]VAS64885.1 Uncharacterised protein [Klebsiella pneumoniae]
MHFQLIAQGHAFAQHPKILLGITLTQRGRKDISGGFAQQRGNAFETTAAGQRQVRQQIARLTIFDKKDHIRDGIEQGRNQRQRIQQRGHIFRPLARQPFADLAQLIDGQLRLVNRPRRRRIRNTDHKASSW